MLAVGFWGAYFGTVVLMTVFALAAYARSQQRVALTVALSSKISALFVVAYLGWLPFDNPGDELRFLAHVAALCSVALGLMLLALLGFLRRRGAMLRIGGALLGVAAAVLALGWASEPRDAFLLASLLPLGIGIGALAVCLRSAWRGEPMARIALSGVAFMLPAIGGLTWIALHRASAPVWLHAASAVAGMAYLASMASALWVRYSYLIELREVRAHGPAYDPVTRMRSHSAMGRMVGAEFFRHEGESSPVGVIVVSLGNLYALEKLHGRAAYNHALFVCASRLRRCVPGTAQMCRLSDDGFLLLLRNTHRSHNMVRLARAVTQRLLQPVDVSTGEDDSLRSGERMQWVADVGVGVLLAPPQMGPAAAVAMARAMSRTAWSFASRTAWFDDAAGQIAELPATDAP